jgi:hypothetical protein
MSQHDMNIANQGFPAFRSDLNNALSAIQTTHSGTSRPTGAVAGQIWLDTTTSTSPTLKYFDGTDDISLATIDHTANTVNWLDSTVSITGLSTTATGTVLTLSDTASTSTVNLIIDNQKEVRFRETTANGTNYIGLKAPASVSADLTFTLPATDGSNGQVLTTNGSGVLSFTTPSAGISWQSSVKTSGFTAVAGEGYFCNTTSSAFTVTLPASPTAGQQIALVDYAGTFDTNALTISPNGNKIEGATSNLQLTGEREGVLLVYIDSTQGWLATSGINEGTDALSPETYSIDFLVVAGGGGGADASNGGGNHSYGSGGGGAGGYRTSTQTVGIGTAITITVGDGGTGGTTGGGSPAGTGTNGSDSSISGSGLTTITSTGGGKGGTEAMISDGGGGDGSSGGSGGGGGGSNGRNSLAGSGNTPSTSPSQGNNGGLGSQLGGTNGGGGGGGGAGAVGANASGDTGGNGGNGTASSITGSSVTRAGGGGGGSNGAVATGGTGGGGNGGNSVTSGGDASSATANTGGGGGGGGSNGSPNFGDGGAGGKGVVILRVPTAKYSGTTTGSPTVTTDGSFKVLQFNGSGSYTT